MDTDIIEMFTLLNQITENGIAVIEITEKRHDPLFIATHPIIRSDWKYLTVTGVSKTHGGSHTLHYVKDNAESGYLCEWGDCGSTLVTANVQDLKQSVKRYLNLNGYCAD